MWFISDLLPWGCCFFVSPLHAGSEWCLLGTMLTATWHGQSDTGYCDGFDVYKVAKPSSDVLKSQVAIHRHTYMDYRWIQHLSTIKGISYIKLPLFLTYNWLHSHSLNCSLMLAPHRISQKSPKVWLQNWPVTPALAETTDCACQWWWAERTTLSLAMFQHSSVTSLNSNWAQLLQQRAA